MEHTLINDVAVCIIAAWALAVLAQILRQPLMLAYLIAGFAIGPSGFGWVGDKGSVAEIAHLGLIVLLFMIGLEIDLKKMLHTGRTILVTGLVQILGTAGIALAVFWWLGFPLKSGSLDALYLAVAVALSSTAIIVKILYEKRELDTIAGRITIGILILQDLFAIGFLAIQPSLKSPSLMVVPVALGKFVFLAAVALAMSRYVLPPLFRAVARLPELVSIGALAWCFLMAGLGDKLGLSREMGALMAGVAISTFPYTIEIAAKITSIRDFFVTLFFVTLGIAVPAPTPQLVTWALAITAGVVVSRFLLVSTTLYFQRNGLRASLLPAINLAQISELSLVLMALGMNAGEILPSTAGLAAYSFALLAILSSYGMTYANGLLNVLTAGLRKLRVPDLNDIDAAPGKVHEPKIVLLGFSWTASSMLEEISARYPQWLDELAVIDFNPTVNEKLRQRNVHAIYGDISQRDTLLHAGIDKAQIIICTLPNTVLKGTNNMKLLRLLREISPGAKIIVHAEMLSDVSCLYQAGASYVSLPRLVEATQLVDVVHAARNKLLDEISAKMNADLHRRNEVIP